MAAWLGSSWQTVGYVVASTTAMYCSAIVAVRIAGRRTVAQFSAFDVLVTVALGSVIASTAVSRDPSYAQGLAAMVTLLVLRVAAGAARRRFAVMRRLLDFAPCVVARDGELRLPTTPLGPQLTADEVLSELRTHGVHNLDDVRLVVIEPSGRLSVIPHGASPLGMDDI